MSYSLRFHELALAEWRKLDGSVRTTLKKKLTERLDHPRVPAAALAGMPDCYKIKLRQQGYRLVYRVDDAIVFVTVISIGRRDKSQAYVAAQTRHTDIIEK
jgi:mRNA interferase RelE/StbE